MRPSQVLVGAGITRLCGGSIGQVRCQVKTYVPANTQVASRKSCNILHMFFRRSGLGFTPISGVVVPLQIVKGKRGTGPFLQATAFKRAASFRVPRKFWRKSCLIEERRAKSEERLRDFAPFTVAAIRDLPFSRARTIDR
jgi:hypothetical protein